MQMTQREIHMLGNDPEVPKQRFVDELWSLRPIGNPEDTYIVVGCAVGMAVTFVGEKLTFEKIVTKYKEYLRDRKTKDTPDQFIRGIKNFVIQGGYNEEFAKPDEKLMKLYGPK